MTRAVVVKPQRRSDFNGTVVVEWLNVSGGADTGADWMQAHTELIREGYAWVGVSAQKVGVDALRGSDPQRGDAVRYAGLTHPGDSFSYDIYSQAGRAIRRDRAVLGRFRPDHVIAVGESQSAGRLVTYIDAVHPLAGVYDGFLVHSRRDGGAPLSQAPQADVPVPAPAPIRDDLDEPVLVFQAETDVLGGLAGTRRPDTDTYRLWEVAGTAPVSFSRDADGNALGGIRTPAVDAPVAALSGVPAPGGTSFCFLFGTTVPFTPERLAELYPTHRSFVQAWRQAAHEARRAGFLTRTDANHLVAAAAASDIGT